MDISPALQQHALDLSQTAPRSAREKLGGFVIAARTLDKCRAVLAGTEDEYHFDCPLDNMFLGFAGIEAEDFKAKAATGADDEEMGAWIQGATSKSKQEIIAWNNEMLAKRLCDLPMELQEFMETYIPENLPSGKPIYVLFDVYDIEEGRL